MGRSFDGEQNNSEIIDNTPVRPVSRARATPPIRTSQNNRASKNQINYSFSTSETPSPGSTPWIYSPLPMTQDETSIIRPTFSRDTTQKKLANLVIRDFDELLQLKAAKHAASIFNCDEERKSRIHDRLHAYLSINRDTKAAERLRYITEDEIKKCSQEEWWATYVYELSHAQNNANENFYKIKSRKGLDELDQQVLEKICTSFEYSAVEDSINPLDKTQIGIMKDQLKHYLKERRNKENLIITLASIKTEEQSRAFQAKAAKQLQLAQEDTNNARSPIIEYNQSIAKLTPKFNIENSSLKALNSSIPIPPDAIVSITDVSSTGDTILNMALKFGDPSLIHAVLNYAEHLDTGIDDLPTAQNTSSYDTMFSPCKNNSNQEPPATPIIGIALPQSSLFINTDNLLASPQEGNFVALVRDALYKITAERDLVQFLYLVNTGYFEDIKWVKQIRGNSSSSSLNPLFSDFFDSDNKPIIEPFLKTATDEELAGLISISQYEFDTKLMEELRRRYDLQNNNSLTIAIPQSILNALKKRAAKTERFEYLTNLFAKALGHICKNLQGENSNHYKNKLDVILTSIQQEPDENTKNTLLEQAEKIAENILNEQNTIKADSIKSDEDISNDNSSTESDSVTDSSNSDAEKTPILYQYRDHSSFHIFAPKTASLIKAAVNPSCSLGLFSNKNVKTPLFNDKGLIDSEQIVNVKKSEIELLIDKGNRSEEAQKRAVLAAHVFENTLRYLSKRPKSSFEKIMDAFSSKPTPQKLLNNSENNDPKYRALMDVINEFILSEEPNAAEILFAKLNDAKSDVGKVLYNTNWPFVTFKAQTFRRLKKDEEKKGSLVPTITV